MFNPSRAQVREFLAGAWNKYCSNLPLTGAEPQVIEIILLHPEYHQLLANSVESIQRDFTPETGQMNPFLHLSLHLAIEEQIAIDQPPGIRAEFQRIQEKSHDRHAALHSAIECLGEMIWRAQRDSSPPDGVAYMNCLRQR